MSDRLSKSQRRERILSELKLMPLVRISELAEKFGVSTETVRRDVDALSSQGLVDRAYGGASARPMGVQPTFGERDRTYIEERERIAAKAISLISPGEVLMIDAGSTTTQFARHLAAYGQDLTVLTNSYSVATALGNGGAIRVILCPGDYVHREAGVYGNETVEFLRRFHANKTFIGAGGLATDGVMDVNSAACWVKRAMIDQSDECFALVDHSKFGRRLLEVVAPLTALDGIVVDETPGAPLSQSLAERGVSIHLAD
ncbi:MAG TPA: DeoR/GlpR family DNA-binding transcription regulator [Alphaproteobacteria bacterium]|nr:DeoR/GlpR family DNA-binding transcription regulator [Alphaproteobacteria bacterium]